MKASILIVGHSKPELVEFGADFLNTYDEAYAVLSRTSYAVVVVADKLDTAYKSKITSCFQFLKEIRLIQKDMQAILISDNPNAMELQKLVNEIGVFKIISNFEPLSLQQAVREALEEYELIKQNEAFLNLRTEQYQKLQNLSQILEERVQARETYLLQSKEALTRSTKRLEALNRALLAIQRSSDKEEMETLINSALHSALGLSWTKILFKNQSFIEKMHNEKSSEFHLFSSPLFKKKELLGHIYFARHISKPFSPDEDDFLLQVGDAVGLTIDRLSAMEQIENLKQEWDSTFDAISDSVSVITKNYDIVRVNKAFAMKAGSNTNKVRGQKCYQVLFSQDSPCQNCVLGENFSLGEKICTDQSQVNFSVNSHPFHLEEGHVAYAMFYRDLSEQKKIENQILESSKMAEIGTIGSSIAHEINNPLGGMLAFIQIIKAELKKEDALYSDISEMEEAALRCKSIVENLLAFTRTSANTEFKETRLGDILKIIFNIIELQTKGLGIQLEKIIENLDCKLKADSNQLVQVFVNVLQNSCEALAERLSQGQRNPPPKISFTTKETDGFLEVKVVDNGPGIHSSHLSKVFTPFFTTKDKSKNPGLGLSVSYQIVKDHLGKMEISSIPGQSTTVIIRLPTAKGLSTLQ